MSGLILFFKSKVVLAILGAVLFGTSGALVATVQFGSGPSRSAPSALQGQAGLAAVNNATATPGSSSASPTKTPTRTPGPRPTNTPRTGGQLINLHGTVQSVNTAANTFTIKQTDGTITTVVVNANTTYQGTASSLSSLRAGWLVEVTGIYQTNGTFAASDVNADN